MGFVATHWRATKVRAELGDRVLPVFGTPVSQVVMRSPRPDHFHDPEEPALASRIRKIVSDAEIDSDKLVPMATMFRAEGGGPLRTQSGGLAHENGWIPLRKAKRLLHWEGVAQRALVVRCESDFAVERIATESVGLTIPFRGGFVDYTTDVETVGPDGATTLWEVKRDERDLGDADFRLLLAMVAEILRRCDIGFGVIFRDEIFRDHIHRANAELFAARAFATVERKHLNRLEEHFIQNGPISTLGALAEALEPTSANAGRALVQALTVRRRVEIDLTQRLGPHTPLTIH